MGVCTPLPSRTNNLGEKERTELRVRVWVRLLRGAAGSGGGAGAPVADELDRGDFGLGEGSMVDIDSESSDSIDRDVWTPRPDSSCK